MRVLLIEDSERLQRSIATGLRGSGYAVDVTGTGTDGLWRAKGTDYDVIILDLMLPGIDGLSLLKQLRDAGRDTHVLILTARDTVDDRVRGLRAGADDYLIKPFAFDELLARIEALTRRQHGLKNPRLRFGELEIDTVARTVTLAGQGVELAAREYALLEFFSLRRGQLVTRSDIEAHLYDDRAELMSNVVDAAVYTLRKKLDLPGRASLIQTRRGMGYTFDPSTE